MNAEKLKQYENLREENSLIRERVGAYLKKESEKNAMNLSAAFVDGRLREIPLLTSLKVRTGDGRAVENDMLAEAMQSAATQSFPVEVPDPDLNMEFSILASEEGSVLPVYTDLEEYRRSGDPDEDCFPLLLEQALLFMEELDLNGLLINAYGKEFLRMPRETAESLLDVLGEILGEGPDDSDIALCRGDITEMDVDAIVNAANNTLLGGSGVDGAIHRAAGPELLEECRSLHGCATGKAKITKGYALKAPYVIHTVGPIYSGSEEDEELLSDCYWNSLDVALENGLHSVAFPCISTGVFGYPKREAAEIAVDTVLDWLEDVGDYEMRVTFCVYDEENYDIYESILDDWLG